jgi:hypothetical protein
MTPPLFSAADVFRARKSQEVAQLHQLEDTLVTVVGSEAATQEIRDKIALQLSACVRHITQRATDCATLREIVDAEVRPVVAEVQAYVSAVLVRQAGLDNGTGIVAHFMLNDIAERAGVHTQVLLAVGEAEYIVHTFSMIRMRQQDATVWRLPILIHELGHHVAQRLTNSDFASFDKFPITRYLENTADTASDRSHLHELFADIFATYVLGSAYPTCVIIDHARLDQGFADADDTHPSWPARVHAMVATLHAMAGMAPGDPECNAFATMADQEVTPMWRALTDHVGDSDTAPGDDDLRRLAKLADDVVGLLITHAPARLRCQLGPQYTLYQGLASGQPESAPAETTIPQVLDAAWRWRSHNIGADDATLARVGDTALRWCAAAAQGVR